VELECRDVAMQKAGHSLVVEEGDKRHARPGEHDDEGAQRSGGMAYFLVPEVPPVDLGLFSRQGPQPLEGLGWLSGPEQGDDSKMSCCMDTKTTRKSWVVLAWKLDLDST